MSWRNFKLDCEQYTYTYFRRNYVCRLCWSTDGVVELMSRSPKSNEKDATIAEKILACVGVDVTTQTFPNKICSNCLDEIEAFIEFKRFCKEADRKLHSILKNASFQHKKRHVKENDYDNLMVLVKESDLELKLLAHEVNKEENLDELILKQETEESLSDFKLDDSDLLSDDLLVEIENYCYSCHLDFDSTEKFANHNLSCHMNEDNGFIKRYGNNKRRNSMQRLDHKAGNRNVLTSWYECNICHTYLRTRILYESHLKTHKENKDFLTDNSLKCSQCSKSFKTSEDLKQHIFKHKNKKNYICEICGRVFNRKDNLDTHKLLHTSVKALKCPHCDHRATQQSSLSVHLRIHTGERPYACDKCPYRCSTSSNLIKHKNLKHLGIKDFKCTYCDKLFRDKCSLNEHLAGVHEQTKPHTCTHCGVQYFRFRSLREHLLVKHGRKIRKVKDDFVEVGTGVARRRRKIMKKVV